MTLEKLYQIIIDRKNDMPKNSYVASLFSAGEDRIIQKIGEEAVEVVIASKNKSIKRQVSEISDLFFHLLILMNMKNISLEMIYSELEKRTNVARNNKELAVQ